MSGGGKGGGGVLQRKEGVYNCKKMKIFMVEQDLLYTGGNRRFNLLCF